MGGIALWATNAVAAQVAFAGLGLGPVLVVMSATAAGVLMVARRPRSPIAPRERLVGMTTGVVGLGGTLVLQYVGFVAGPLLETNVLSYGWPMLAALATAIVARSRGSLLGLGFALLGFAGVAVMFSGSSGGGHGPLGYVAALGSALCMACYTLAIGRVRLPLADVLLAGALTALAAGLVLCVATGDVPEPGLAMLAAAYCGAGPVAGGYLLWSRGMAAGGERLAPLGYAIPLLSTGLLLLGGQSFTGRTAVGAALVLACTVGVLVVGRRVA